MTTTDAPTRTTSSVVSAWATQARAKLTGDGLHQTDLDQLMVEVSKVLPPRRQRLLYLHAANPNVTSGLVAATCHEPTEGGATQIDINAPELPYATVHDAILDGWQVIHFPLQMAPFDDVEVDILGYEFVLQKWVD